MEALDDTNLKSTKFILCALVIVLGFVLVLTGNLPAEQWMGFGLGAAGIYSAANVAQKISK